MSSNSNILQPIIEDTSFPRLLNELNVHWKNEQRLREEFYEKIQPGDKWEFINGKTIMHSPAKEKHTEARKKLSLLLQIFVSLRELGKVHDETALVSLTRNDYLPDIAYFRKEKSDSFSPNMWKYPVPDFIIEILSKGTAKTDRGIKKEDYAKHGTKEYWLIDPDKQTVEQFILNEDTSTFELFTKKTIEDQITVSTITNCTFPVKAIFDEKEKMQVVKKWMR